MSGLHYWYMVSYTMDMATKATTKKTVKKAPAAKAAATKKPKKQARAVAKKKPTAARATVSNKVDYYPNRMTVAVSALAGTILVLVAVIAVLGSRG